MNSRRRQFMGGFTYGCRTARRQIIARNAPRPQV